MADGDGADRSGDVDAALSEEAALELVADETRARILKALGDATVERDGLPALSYTELREKAGIRDSGRFNYHLSKLEGMWVRKTDSGYLLPVRGQHVYGALVAGSFTGDAAPEPFRLEDTCPYCSHRLSVRYTDLDVRLLVVCEFCGGGAMNVYFPPNSLSTYAEDALVDAAARHSRMQTGQMARGQCYNCAGRVDAVVHDRDPTERLPWGDDRRPLDVYVTFHCQECTGFHYTTVGEAVSYHPRVLAFCGARGVDLHAARQWRHDWLFTDRHTTVESTAPMRVTVDVTVDTGQDVPDPERADVLRVTVDETASVVATEEM